MGGHSAGSSIRVLIGSPLDCWTGDGIQRTEWQWLLVPGKKKKNFPHVGWELLRGDVFEEQHEGQHMENQQFHRGGWELGQREKVSWLNSSTKLEKSVHGNMEPTTFPELPKDGAVCPLADDGIYFVCSWSRHTQKHVYPQGWMATKIMVN